jgi:hypothetical protein
MPSNATFLSNDHFKNLLERMNYRRFDEQELLSTNSESKIRAKSLVLRPKPANMPVSSVSGTTRIHCCERHEATNQLVMLLPSDRVSET